MQAASEKRQYYKIGKRSGTGIDFVRCSVSLLLAPYNNLLNFAKRSTQQHLCPLYNRDISVLIVARRYFMQARKYIIEIKLVHNVLVLSLSYFLML